MATGTAGGLLETQATQSLVKHKLLEVYLPVFVHKLGQSGMRDPVTLVDGYAGRGRYPDGKPASAELLLRGAQSDLVQVRVELVEKDPDDFARLETVANEYLEKRPGIWLRSSYGSLEDHWEGIVARARGTHLFLFLDPCGAGVSFDRLVSLVTDRAQRGQTWPRTEVLLNFNADLIRRMSGAAAVDDQKEYRALNAVCGGDWWIEDAKTARAEDDSSWLPALERIVAGYVERLAEATGYSVVAIPVRADVGQQPKFYLVFMTVSGHGVWAFSEAVAQATRAWLEAIDERDHPGQGSLFDAVAEVNRAVFGVVAPQEVQENLKRLISPGSEVGPLVDFSEQLLGQAVGAITSAEITKVVQGMAKDGILTISHKGKGAAGYHVQAVRR